jgi:hypothetical protein
MKTKLPESISSKEQAEAFLDELIINNEAYHPEDDACDTDWSLPEDQIPTAEECEKLNALMGDINNIDGFDPCEYILSKFSNNL